MWISWEGVQTLLDTGVSILMNRLKEFQRQLQPPGLSVMQANGQGIKVSSMMWLTVWVREVSTKQKLYVAPTLYGEELA